MQMAVDFLLEAVGTKGKKIARLNGELEKNKQSILFKSDTNPLSFNAGHYLVYIQRQEAGGSERWNYSIRVNSRDASADVLKEHSVVSGGGTVPGTQDDHAAGSASGPVTPVESAGGSTGNTSDPLKEEFANVIKNWQKVKKSVVRQRQLEDLTQCLSGRALQRQSDAVKWLITNHKYYDMNPLGVTVFRYSELTAGSKYSVIAQVKEASKLMDEQSGKVVKETTDSYKVNYTIEKSGDHWLITVSAIVSPKEQPAAGKPPAAKPGH